MNRVIFQLNEDTYSLGMVRAIDSLTWLKEIYGEGDSWDTVTLLTGEPKLTGRWAFGTWQPTPLHRNRFCIWMPDNIKLLYDVTWPK